MLPCLPTAALGCDPPAVACRALSEALLPCGAGLVAVCRARRCAPIASEGEACAVDPCYDGAVCAAGLACDESTAVCRPGSAFLQPCAAQGGADACTFPFVCEPASGCPASPSATGTCQLGLPSGASCDSTYGDHTAGCSRCSPGLDCVNGACTQRCRADLDCPCGVSCRPISGDLPDGYCRGPCSAGEACGVDAERCGTCLRTTHALGNLCVPVGAVEVGGTCRIDPQPSAGACFPPFCEEGSEPICQGRRCATVLGEDEPCDTDPCGTGGPPRICAYPLTCRADCAQGPGCAGRCENRFAAQSPFGIAACSARSRNNLPGNACPFPYVCEGYEGEHSGTAGGCGSQPGPSLGNGACLPGVPRGGACDASFLDLRPSCARCEPGLSCVGGRCLTPCASDAECPCLERCNGGFCGLPSGPGPDGTPCTAAPGVCGTCAAGRCIAGAVISEGCARNPGVDDDCDGVVDEATPDRVCDGIDDDCDGQKDEEWSEGGEFTTACPQSCTSTPPFTTTCESDCPDADVPGHVDCRAGELVSICEAGRDFCTGPGAFPAPLGGVYWCGGGEGEPCWDVDAEVAIRPCWLDYACNRATGLCVASTAVPGCGATSALCNPNNAEVCLFCQAARLFPDTCEWPP